MASAFGFTPSRKLGGGTHALGANAYRKENGKQGAMFKGDPVKLDSGYIAIADNGDKVLGAIAGFAYVDPTSKEPIWTDHIAASVSSQGAIDGISDVVVYVYDDPDYVYKVAARASLAVTAGHVGSAFSVSAGSGNAITGQSGYSLQASTTVGAGMVRITGLNEGDPSFVAGTSGQVVEAQFINRLYDQYTADGS